MSFVYVDTSVALAHLLAEDRTPRREFWNEPLISSRLIEYELWNRIHNRALDKSHGDAVRALVGRLALVELVSPILTRALEPFPTPVRTLDALHLASVVFLLDHGQDIQLATYDAGMAKASRAMKIRLYSL